MTDVSDWEYPVASDRGGVPADYSNLVLLVSDIREAFDSYDPGWQLTLTLPASYWYLQNFDIKRLEKYVDWFNMMTYDIHGVWDQHNIWTGPYLKGHTNITEIEDGLDLMWRNGINSDKVVMGYGFYGRGFTMKSPSCSTPPNCEFSGPAFGGDCTNEPGILSYNGESPQHNTTFVSFTDNWRTEVMSKQDELSAVVKYDKKSSVKWMTYGSNQWVSFDDAESFQEKLKYQHSRCLKGLMIWDLGLDTANYDALIGLFGEDAVSAGLQDSTLNPDEEKQLAFDLSAYTGQNCYVSTVCTDGKSKSKEAICKAGYSSAAVGHQLKSGHQEVVFAGGCLKGEFKHICCPNKAMPKNCEWIGAPERSVFGCDGKCGKSQFELNQDLYADQYGNAQCGSGHRSLCCDSTPILQKCHWTDCDWTSDSNGNCASDEVNVATRYDDDDGFMCKTQTGMGNGGQTGTVTHQHFRSYCCPKSDPLEKCSWSNDPEYFSGKWKSSTYACEDDVTNDRCRKVAICQSRSCFDGKLAVTRGGVTPAIFQLGMREPMCWLDRFEDDGGAALCCSPPSRLTKEWPVNPAYLWSGAHTEDDDDVTWQWSNNFGNNNKDTMPNNLEEDPGDDPYGFVMLDGPPGSIAKQFSKQFTFITENEPREIVARSFVTTNQSVIDATFDHVEEEYLVYCNYRHDSRHCNEIFHKGSVDTIIKLPEHIGHGPYARVVSMEPEAAPPTLPAWTIRKRDASGVHRNGLYRLKFDYNFHAIKREDDEEVFMRVDYTNLKDYWDEVTDKSSTSKRKRSASDHMNYNSWRSRVDNAKNASYINGHNEFHVATEGIVDFSPKSLETTHIERRWFGSFTNWLKKLNTITKTEDGFLPMGLSKVFNIYSGRLQCANPAGVTITAGLDITADVRMEMGARYAYYFSGTVVPPKIIDTYVFLGAQPSVYAGIDIRGNAELGYESERKKLISTITYPGLSIKGIASVGPSLDLWGQLAGKITVSGNMKVGAKYTMDPIEMYMPNDDSTRQKASNKMKNLDKEQAGLSPVFQAGVKANVGVELRLTPEINCGIKVGGDIGPLKQPLVQAQVAVYTNTTLYFEAHATADTDGKSGNWEYGYKIELRWRVGMDAVANLYLYGSWKSTEFEAVAWQTIPIYGPVVVKSAPAIAARDLHASSGRADLLPWEVPEDPLPNAMFGLPDFTALYEAAPAEDSMMISAHLYNHTDLDISQSSNLTARALTNYAHPANPVFRRATGKENEFMLGDFKCTSGDSPCSAALNSPAKLRRTEYEHAHSIKHTHGNHGMSIRTIQELEKRVPTVPPTLDCPQTLPRFYYNCVGMFADSTITGPSGVTITIPGICTSVRKYLTAHGINTNQYPLHWDPIYNEKRRGQSCDGSRSPCTGPNGDNERYKTTLGINGAIVSCDEFPFASSEEGGWGWDTPLGDAALHPTNPLGTTRTCVPVWQQTLQGNCNSKYLLSLLLGPLLILSANENPEILSTVMTNVEYFNKAGSPNTNTDDAAFYAWSDKNWNRDKAFGAGKNPGRQRLTEYPSKRPYLIHGDNIKKDHEDWYHKRNFTLFLVNNAPGAQADFPGNAFSASNIIDGTKNRPVTTTITEAAWIMCAVSLRGQTRFKFNSRFNGYCWDGTTTAPAAGGNYQRLQYYACKIDFVGATFVNKKRSEPIGFFHDEPVYGVERIEDGNSFEVVVPSREVQLPDSRDSFPLS
jgi:hypothetical protein